MKATISAALIAVLFSCHATYPTYIYQLMSKYVVDNNELSTSRYAVEVKNENGAIVIQRPNRREKSEINGKKYHEKFDLFPIIKLEDECQVVDGEWNLSYLGRKLKLLTGVLLFGTNR
jgi:hypothetical protein